MKILYRLYHFIDNKSNWIAIMILAALFLFYLSKGSILSADSSGYIQKDLIRSPLYPLLINAIEWLFGKGNYIFLVVFQLLLGCYTCYRIAKFFQTTYKLNGVLFLLILLIAITPYTFYFGNTILSEGLAYPLFLLTVQFFFEALLSNKQTENRTVKQLGKIVEKHVTKYPEKQSEKHPAKHPEKHLERQADRHPEKQMGKQTHSQKSYFYFLFFLTLLVLTRRQYLFFYVAAFIGFLYLCYFAENLSKFQKMSFLIALLVSLSATDLLERSYHKYYNGYFTTVPFVGLQIMAMPLYLSSDKDVSLFPDEKEANIFKTTRRIMKENKYDSSTLWKEDEGPEYCHYYMNYNNVTWGSLSKALAENNLNDWMQIDKTLIHMSGPLFKTHWKRIGSLYLRNIIHSMGGYYNFIFITFAFICSAWFHYLKRDKLSLGVFLAILLSFGNYFSVALVEPAMTRYTFSTNIILISMLIVTAYYAFKSSRIRY